jgi:hypothetical protein
VTRAILAQRRALLAVDGDDALLGEARDTARHIVARLPSAQMRERFLAAEAVRRLGPVSTIGMSSPDK